MEGPVSGNQNASIGGGNIEFVLMQPFDFFLCNWTVQNSHPKVMTG